MKKQFLIGDVKSIDEKGVFQVIASTADVDRDGEVIDPQGWDLDNYMKNPIILWAHNYTDLPIGVAEKIEKSETGLIIKGKFASKEANPKAEQVRRLYEEGIQKAVSVGFIPRERDGNNDRLITKAELLELSFVPVPANPNALALAVSKGFKDEEIKELFEEKEEEKADTPAGFKIQTLILSKDKFETLEEAKKWIIDNGFKVGKDTKPDIDETENSWRFRQFDPAKCQDETVRTINITSGVTAVICRSGKCEIISYLLERVTEKQTEPQERKEPADREADKKVDKKSGEATVEVPIKVLQELRSHSKETYQLNEVILSLTKKVLSKQNGRRKRHITIQTFQEKG